MAFFDTLESWYEEHGRALPWRGIDNPYFIWLSEIILQQTRIEQGEEYYKRFIATFPTVADLAAATEEQVLRLWQGLGYYSRARNLHAAARYIMDQCGGRFPQNHVDLLKMKGVGRYTAAAIASFAFKEPIPVIDGNVYRFISRLRGIATPIATPVAYNEFEQVLLKLIDRDRPDIFNAALMDFGSLQCRPKPDCASCPFQSQCEALQTGRVDLLPVKTGKVAPSDRWFLYFDMRTADSILIHRRTGNDIWRGLWELPMLETKTEIQEPLLDEVAAEYLSSSFALEGIAVKPIRNYIHQLTHRTIHALFLKAELEAMPAVLPENTEVCRLEELKKRPVSRLIDKYLQDK